MKQAAATTSKSLTDAAVLSRRTFMQTSAAVGTTALLVPTAKAAGTSLEGYTAATSAAPGGLMDFFLRDPQAVGSGTTVYPITFTRVGQPDVYMSSTTVAIGAQAVPADASTNGCRWTRSFRLTIPSNWPSGLYYAYIGSGGNACTVPFVVRAATAAGTAGIKTLVCIPVLTVHAYNAYGGKSIYDYNSSNGQKATQVSLDRPFTEAFNSFFDTWSQYLVRFMAKNNLAADFCTDVDIEAGGAAVLAPYQLYVQAGHDEYWSKGRRDTMEAFVAAGGNCAYLGGNTAWFQSRMAVGNGVANRTLVCYKDAAADPVTDLALDTINFISLTPPRPENIMTGSGFLTGCSWTSGTIPRPDTPSVTLRPEHWAFAGTGLAQGAGFGGAYVGYECNAALFAKGTDQRCYPLGTDGTPASTRILAQADGSNWNELSLAAGGGGEQSGYAAVTVFSNGGSAGTVFSTGSSDWSYGLIPELNGQTATPLSRITLNVINKLRQAWTESADVRQYRSTVGSLSNYYFTTATSAPAGSNLALDGWAFRAFPQPVNGSVPVYLKRSTAANVAQRTYYLQTVTTVGANEALVGVAFHAYPTARTGATAIYEHYAFNQTLQLWVAMYSPLATPPAGYTAGPVKFYAPLDTVASTPVVAVPGFTLSAVPTALTVVQGQTGSSAVTVNKLNGFSGTVSFSASGLPANVSASFTSVSSDSGTTLRLAAAAGAAPGSYQVTVNGLSGSATSSVVVTLVVAAAASFTLALDSNSLTLPLVGVLGLLRDNDVKVQVVGANGFTAPVTFSVTGVPSGVAASLSPTTSATGTELTLSKQLLGFPGVGNYTVTVKGVSGSLSATATLTLSVVLLF